jgi:hypothetical protein
MLENSDTMLQRFPIMSGRLLPSLSMNNIHKASPMRAIMLLIAWYFRAFDPEMPICP